MQRENWWIASYSALRIGDSLSAGEAPESALAQSCQMTSAWTQMHRVMCCSAAVISTVSPVGQILGRSCMACLEWAGSEGFKAQPAAIEDAVARRCNRRGWEGWIDTLSEWLVHLQDEPLRLNNGQPAVVLSQLTQYQIEMEFWFASHNVDVLQLDQRVRQHTHGGRRAQGLSRACLMACSKVLST